MSLQARGPGRALRAIWMLGAVAALAGCQQAPKEVAADAAAPAAAAAAPAASAGEDAGTVIAVYNGKNFTLADYRAALKTLNGRARKSLDENGDRRKQFVENFIVSKLIFAEGIARGFDKDAEVQRRMEELKEHLVIQLVMEEQQSASVTDEEVKAYYDAHTEEFSTEKVKASHILVDDEALAREIAAKLSEDKTQFEALAAEHSKDLSNAKRGGDLGMFGRGRMVKEFEDIAFGLENDGDISPPVRTRFGWHVIKRTAREDGVVQPFDEVKAQIQVKMVSEQRREKTTGFLEELKTKSKLSVDEKALADATSGQTAEEAEADDKPASGH